MASYITAARLNDHFSEIVVLFGKLVIICLQVTAFARIYSFSQC